MPWMLFPVTVPSSLLSATTLVVLNALLKLAVELLFTATDRSPEASASPVRVRLWTLLSELFLVLDLLCELLSLAFNVIWFWSTDTFVPSSPLPFVWLPAANAAPLNAKASADANSVFFMKPPVWVDETQGQAIDLHDRKSTEAHCNFGASTYFFCINCLRLRGSMRVAAPLYAN